MKAVRDRRNGKQIEEYLAMPYTTELVPNEDGSWFARVAEFPGCMTEGDTKAHALEMLDDATRLWLQVCIEDGLPIPEPLPIDAFSGKFLVRVPKSLHRDLARRADAEGVSLNQLVLSALSRSIGLGK